jgi:hypothetical protein
LEVEHSIVRTHDSKNTHLSHVINHKVLHGVLYPKVDNTRMSKKKKRKKSLPSVGEGEC